MVDHTGSVARAEAVVDIHHRQAAGAGVEHRQQRRHTAEGRTVPHTGGNGDHRAVGKPAHHAGESALHPGDGDDHAGAHNVLQMGEQTVDARYAHIIDALHLVAQHPGSERRLRVVFNGAEATGTPLIANMAVEEGILANILSASTRSLNERTYGSMLLGVPNEDETVKRAVAYLMRMPEVLVEEV